MSDALIDTYLAANAAHGGGDLGPASGDAVSVRMAEAQAARGSIRHRRLVNTRKFVSAMDDGTITPVVFLFERYEGCFEKLCFS